MAAAAAAEVDASSPLAACVSSEVGFCGRMETGASPRRQRQRLKSGEGRACSDLARMDRTVGYENVGALNWYLRGRGGQSRRVDV